MSKRMLIDAAHQEEVRVVILNEGVIEDFDYQINQKKSTKGNIYLAKITRVEPSLQAAFVEYGAQKHGFLPFSEIHPDYYQIPVSDREELLNELKNARKKIIERLRNLPADGEANHGEELAEESEYADRKIEEEEEPNFRPSFLNRYKIQEVIKKDQVLLVQIEKEERGNKGASLTTYISLPGRYCVFMPNSTKGCGVSRKIVDDEDRMRLKKVASELTEECEGSGSIIIRTAGSYKTKTEIKRDYAYLQNLWNKIREHTMKSKAPEFIYEEGDVIKKSIRDLYDGDLEEIIVSGEKAHEEAKEFMKMLLPRHVNKVKLHADQTPLFFKYRVEDQLAELHSHQVSLPSGGYLVINQTEALVAVDVNSGRATRERSVESTAVKTNIEAAHEVARQMRLRDLSGLLVVDFIDMEELKNKKAVERALKEALAHDRAKVHVGRISQFGLLEMSRQRLKQNFVESTTEICEHCNGRGRVRPLEATAIVVLRAIADEIATGKADEVQVSGSSRLMFHILNNKRHELDSIEKSTGCKISFYADESGGADGFFIEKIRNKKSRMDTERTALSGVDEAPSEEMIESIDSRDAEADGEGEFQSRSRFKKRRGGRDRFKNRDNSRRNDQENTTFNDEKQPAELTNTDEDAEVVNFPENISHESEGKPFRKKRFKKGGGRDNRGRGKDRPNTADMPPAHAMHEEDGDSFDEEMAERRKRNQSLLKEIWKKIVE